MTTAPGVARLRHDDHACRNGQTESGPQRGPGHEPSFERHLTPQCVAVRGELLVEAAVDLIG